MMLKSLLGGVGLGILEFVDYLILWSIWVGAFWQVLFTEGLNQD